jgi:Uma2 family endonuclease
MGQPAPKDPRATYADLAAVSSGKVAELVAGTLHVMPRPAPKHAVAAGALGAKLTIPFGFGEGGPGGWWILPEPELHFADPSAPGASDVIVPDSAGWRRARMPELPDEAFFELAPDWICEVLSKRTERFDRDVKMPVYEREGVRCAWLVDPVACTLEAFVLGAAVRWGAPVVYRGDVRACIEPFDAIALDLSALWAR